jgi:acyl carrier protein
MTVREEVIAFLQRCGLEELGQITGDTALISSGLLDSLALFNLVVWVEERLGVPLDPSAVDLTTEWATVDALARFVEARGGAPAIPPSR